MRVDLNRGIQLLAFRRYGPRITILASNSVPLFVDVFQPI